ncbi:MAG: hypothetical protein TECD_00367 [Hyphomicrobiaceae bacterium hypho_1]
MVKLTKLLLGPFKQIVIGIRQTISTYMPIWIKKSVGPIFFYLDMLFLDHGIFRIVYFNKHKLSGTNGWRSAQPTPYQLAELARHGIKTVVNLRGERVCGSYFLEKEACTRYGLTLENYQIRSRASPTPAELYGARDLFQRIEYPMLMHCKAGADRVGLMSILFLHIRYSWSIENALKEHLSLKYGHIRQANTGILDHFFKTYIKYNRHTPIDFFDWVDTAYDPSEVHKTFYANGFANRLIEDILHRE